MMLGWSHLMSWKKVCGNYRSARLLLCECGSPLRRVPVVEGRLGSRLLVCRGCGLTFRVIRGFVVSDSHGVAR